MKHFEIVYQAAVKEHGVITWSKAASLGVSSSELNRFCADGRLERRGRGVYRITHYAPTPLTRYTETLALVGKDAHLYGSAVLSLNRLVDIESNAVSVASNARVRKRLPEWVHLKKSKREDVCIEYDGIPCQPVADAIIACASELPITVLQNATEVAHQRRLVSGSQRRSILQALGITTAGLSGEGNSSVEVPV